MTHPDERPTPELIMRIQAYLHQCAPHVAERQAPTLLADALAALAAEADRVSRLERERDEARATIEVMSKMRQLPAEGCPQCFLLMAERNEVRADRDQFRVMWERDSKALGDVIGQRDTARAVAEDNRARYVTAEAERDALREALRETLTHCECECEDIAADIQTGADPAGCLIPCFHCRSIGLLGEAT